MDVLDQIRASNHQGVTQGLCEVGLLKYIASCSDTGSDVNVSEI